MSVRSQPLIPDLSTPGNRRGQTPLKDARRAHEGGQSPPRRWLARLLRDRSIVLAALAAAALVLGGALHLAGYPTAGTAIWGAAVAVLSAELLVEVVWTVAVKHHMGVDVVALVAMIGALLLGQELAGLIVGLMYSGGATLEELASARARRDLTALVQRAPKVARVRVGDDYRIVAVDEVAVGDIVSVRAGEVVPVDGTLASDEAVLDTSTLTGEPLPVSVSQGMKVLSGTANAGPPMEVRTERPASESAYAALVRLVDRA
jgi:cation transport ATPase